MTANIEEIVTKYTAYIKALPPQKFYSFCHGSYDSKVKAWNEFVRTLNLSYTEYKTMNTLLEGEDINDYLDIYLVKPPKKAVPKKKVVDEDDEW